MLLLSDMSDLEDVAESGKKSTEELLLPAQEEPVATPPSEPDTLPSESDTSPSELDTPTEQVKPEKPSSEKGEEERLVPAQTTIFVDLDDEEESPAAATSR